MGYPSKPRQQAVPDIRQVVREELATMLKPNLERLQALTGDRGNESMKAVTRGDLSGAGRVNITAVPLTVAPTEADFNRVVTDLKLLASLLERMGANIGGT